MEEDPFLSPRRGGESNDISETALCVCTGVSGKIQLVFFPRRKVGCFFLRSFPPYTTWKTFVMITLLIYSGPAIQNLRNAVKNSYIDYHQ